MTAVVCDFCDTNLATGSRWFGGVKADSCDQCALHLATHPHDRSDFAQDLAEAES